VTSAAARFLVLGCTGQLGPALVRELEARGAAVAAPPEAEVDLLHSDLGAVVGAASPTAVIRGIPLVHVSTDYVFDGRNQEPYREEDPTAPLQAYGRTKLDGERAVIAAHPSALVVRTSTLFGTNRRGGSNYIAAVLARATAAPALEVVRLPVSSPTYAPDLGRGILRLLDAGAAGLVHVVNSGGCSRLELATEAVRLAGLAGRVEIRERPAATTGAPRPAYSVLDTARYTALTGDSMRPWQEAVRDYVEELA
jgi:dTDP-4-dehydrorhamnose reductase